MRDEVLADFIEQPPAPPITQYLRDAERVRAVDLVGRRGRVLDIGSEANVTKEFAADEITRLDFSPNAIDHARDRLGDTADRYESVPPDDPALPFPDDAFDAVVSIGPYDWKFLDVEGLTAEVRRVLAADGRFVFSVPTPRSPYYIGSKRTQRFYTPEEAFDLIYPGFRLADYELIYQYYYRIRDQIHNLDEEWQERAAALADRLSALHTRADLWENASYIVFALTPTPVERLRDDALAALFRPTDENGFYEADAGRIVRGLAFDEGPGGADGAGAARASDDRPDAAATTGADVFGPAEGPALGEFGEPVGDLGLRWRPIRTHRWRYVPLALFGACRWRVSPFGDDRHDERLRRALDHAAGEVERTGTDAIPSYGFGPLVGAFALADGVLGEYAETATDLFERTRDRVAFDHSEDALALYGWTYLYEATGDDAVLDAVEDGLWAVADHQEPDDRFVFDNGTTRRHQNQMYAVWGLCRAIEVTGLTGFLNNAERALDFTVADRMREDGGILWEDVPRRRRLRTELGRLRQSDPPVPHWDLLYPCHQSFFTTAAAHYAAAGGETRYDTPVGRALNWLVGDNEWGMDLAAASGLGVPIRLLTTDGEHAVDGQRYKGAYEVGALIQALTLVGEEFSPVRPYDSE